MDGGGGNLALDFGIVTECDCFVDRVDRLSLCLNNGHCAGLVPGDVLCRLKNRARAEGTNSNTGKQRSE